MVPALVVHCLREVECRGLNELGIYRVPGSEREVKSLKVFKKSNIIISIDCCFFFIVGEVSQGKSSSNFI